MKKIRTAIVGCGVISDIYMENLKNKFSIIELVACSDLNQERMLGQSKKFNIKPMTYDEILADESMELVINLTNPSAHYSIINSAIEHGKNIFSEKMLAVTFEEGKELVKLARNKHVRLGVAPDTFLGAGIQTAGYILQHGLIGSPNSFLISLARDNRVFAEFLPHLAKKGGTILFDMGCYYFAALVSLLGPVESVHAYGNILNSERVNQRVTSPQFGTAFTVDDYNIITAIIRMKSGIVGTAMFNAETNIGDKTHYEIYGSNGILDLGDPNSFDGQNILEKPYHEPVAFPFTHGYAENSRGVGAADMAWAIEENRKERASGDLGLHVLEIVTGIEKSIESGHEYVMQTAIERPMALKEGYLDNGFWGPTEETALLTR